MPPPKKPIRPPPRPVRPPGRPVKTAAPVKPTRPVRTQLPPLASPPVLRQKVTPNSELRPGKFTVNELLNRTRSNFPREDWARANAHGAPFKGDKGLTYNTTLKVMKPSQTPWGIRFRTRTTDPTEFGRDPLGRFPRQYVQYIQLSRSFAATNVNGEKTFQVFCSCHRFKFYHHYVLWKNGHAPKPFGAGQSPPNKTNPFLRPGMCKHLILAMLALRRLSLANALPAALPESDWAKMALYWKRIESRGLAPENVNAPNDIKRIAKEVRTTGRVPRGTPPAAVSRVLDFSDKIGPPKRVR